MKQPLEAIPAAQAIINNLQTRLEDEINYRNWLVNEAYKSGATIAELSRATGVSRNTIYKIVQTRKP